MSLEMVGGLTPSHRDPRVAAVLGFIWPGVGYLYAGQGLWGLALLLFFPMADLSVLLLAVLVPVERVCVAIPAILTLALHLFLARCAARAASRSPSGRPLPLFSRWYSCLAALALTYCVNALWVRAYRITFVEAYKIPTGAMESTIRIGDHLLGIKWAYGWREPLFGKPISDPRRPKRGELVIFRFPEDRSRVFVKRCIGLPGDTVEIRSGSVLIGGKPLDEPYLKPSGPSTEAWGPQVVPDDGYFVLGDNRENSRDSRYWGFVPQGDLLGRAAVVYWSYEATRDEYGTTDVTQWLKNTLSAFFRTRWERIGRRLE